MNEELMVELAGRADKYLKMLDEATDKTNKAGSAIANKIEDTQKKVENSLAKTGESSKHLADKFGELDMLGRKLQGATNDAGDLSKALASGNFLQASTALGQLVGDMGELATKAGLAKLATMALGVGLVAGLAFGAYEGIRALTGVNDELKKFEEESEKARRETEKFAAQYKESTDDIIKSANDMSLSMRTAFVEGKASDVTGEVKNLEAELKRTKKELDGLDNVFNRNFNEVTIERSKLQVEELNKKLDVARQRQDKLNDTVRKFKFPETNRELIQQINTFTNKLHENSQAIGLSSSQAEILKFKLQGATEQMLAAGNAAIFLNEKLMKVGRAQTEAQSIIEETTESLRNFGRTADKIKLLKLNKELEVLQENLKEAQELRFKLLQDLIKAPPDRVAELGSQFEKALDNVSKLSTEIMKFQAQMRNVEPLMMMRREAEELKKLGERGEELKKQFRNPFEQFEDGIKELRNLFKRGLIGEDTFERAIDDAINKLDKATNSANKFKESLKFDAAKFGSAEALDRMEEATRHLKEQFEELQRKRALRERFNLPELKDKERLERKTVDTINRLNPVLPTVVPRLPVQESKDMEVKAARADSSLDVDRKEMINLLKSIDKTLITINNKPDLALGAVKIEGT